MGDVLSVALTHGLVPCVLHVLMHDWQDMW